MASMYIDRDTSMNVTVENMLTTPMSKTHLSATLTLTFDVISLVLNVFPILVVYTLKRKDKRLTTDILIASLSFTDQLCILLPLFVTVLTLSGVQNNNACKCYYFFVFLFQNSAMVIVMVLSCERFVAVVFPFKYKLWSSQRRTYLTVLGIYVFSFVIAISTITELGDTSTVDKTSLMTCKSWLLLVPMYSGGAFPSILIFEGWVSMIVVLICNVSLIRNLLRYKRLLEIGSTSVGLSRQHLRDFTKMVILVTILFYITWLPVLSVMTLIQFGESVDPLVASFCLMATSINGLVNPFVYFTLSKQYRQGYMALVAGLLNRLNIHMRCLGSGSFVVTSTSCQTTKLKENVLKPSESERKEIFSYITNL
ncbi:galanin receptor type 2-like [Anneissia japonica]|uniref:galanin receptor type 2-like n=1 Tax=Anneissia japonica TaxID=1529436 RepID=UPI0014258087|nr:galanin receptor type 2-like [Anneissia japonica]